MELDKLLNELQLGTFIAFDFETTGLSPTSDRIIEIAAIRFENGLPVDELTTLVNPEKVISDFITEITGISNKMVADAPVEADIVSELKDFIGSRPLVAHNIPFDISFLDALFGRYDIPKARNTLYDTLTLARGLIFDQPAFNLSTTAELLGLDPAGAHRAGKDAENCGCIFVKLIQEAATLPLETLSKIVQLTQPFDLPNRNLYENLANLYARKGLITGSLDESSRRRDMLPNYYHRDGNCDISSLTAESVFGSVGKMAKSMADFEERPDQVRYAQFVEQAISGKRTVGVIEAGTGLGKSLAYLFPACKKALTEPEQKPVIISCYTKHLQDQLFHKDLPQLAEALDLQINAVVMKGRRNYVCKTRLSGLVADAKRMLSEPEVESLIPVLVWLDFTQSGDLSECGGFWSAKPGRVIPMITSETGYCTTSLCHQNNGCFFGKLRQHIFSSNLIIVNHALLLTELNFPGYLPEYDTVLLDEGHNLVSAAYQQLTLQFDRHSVQNVLRDADPTQTLNFRWSHYLEYIASLKPDIEKLRTRLFACTARISDECEALFGGMAAVFLDRYPPNAAYTQKTVTENLTSEYAPVQGELISFRKELKILQEIFIKVRSVVQELDSSEKEHSEFTLSLDKNIDQLESLAQIALALTENQDPEWVYWQEGRYVMKKFSSPILEISLFGAPVNVSKALRKEFFESVDYSIVTSATLQIDDSFDYFMGRSGISGLSTHQVKTKAYASPFYYQDQVKYYQYSGRTITNDASAIGSVIYNCTKKYNKRIMALFTAHATLNSVYKDLRNRPGGRDLPLFAQGFGASRYALIKGMRSVKNGILLGTNSFWEGVDLPGELLEVLIITKLPFDVPTEPIIKAYSNQIKEQGGNSFTEFSIPECVMKFRQGFGRLIRTTTDDGIFIVLDDRIINKSYGRHFRDAIPAPYTVFTHLEDLGF